MPDSWYNAISREAQDGLSATEAVSAVLPGGAAVGAAIGAAKIAGGAAGGGGGSWSFDPEEIDAVIADWKALSEDLNADRDVFQVGAHANAPSEDQPSGAFMQSLTEGLNSLRESNVSMLDYVQGFIEKLEEAKRSIEQAESDNSGALASNGAGEE
ncbi:hypothetical protein B1813_09190 [Saccharomonospora piscinae]|uniref:Uncharacterized protein n=2 Tax=Saccharomonospora piscinae TaxID=687388 RepID=A0A1V9A7Q3_SACPI|nr:hypothetical protein [Saccharomonospora piscinae]OQO93157.1 hypothetical protein B1813_09190 [Saccharomonospora piscinae]